MYVTSYAVFDFPFTRVLIRLQYTEWNSSYFASSHPVRKPLVSFTPLTFLLHKWHILTEGLSCNMQCPVLDNYIGVCLFPSWFVFFSLPQKFLALYKLDSKDFLGQFEADLICLASKITDVFSNTILPSSYAGQLKLMAAAYVVLVFSAASLVNN